MKILILSKKFPYPLREGEPIAITYLSRSLASIGCDVSILVMNTSKHYFDPRLLPADYNHFSSIQTVEVDTRIKLTGALISLVRGDSYILSRFRSQEYELRLSELLQKESFDVVQLETIYMAHYIPLIRRNSAALISLRAHNVEHEIWERVASTTGNLLKKGYLLYQNRHLRRFEMKNMQACDILVAITERDLEVCKSLGFNRRNVVAPVGIDLADYPVTWNAMERKQSIGFIGALDWMPNQLGVTWFLDQVWPVIAGRFPDMEFHIAGKNTPDWLVKRSGNGVFVHGEVPDAKAFICDHPVLVAPLFSGSGIKIKVLEGMALARAVITTPVGAEGIPAKPGEELLIAGDADSFIHAIEWCFQNRERMKETGLEARSFIGSHFDNRVIATRVMKAYQQLKQDT